MNNNSNIGNMLETTIGKIKDVLGSETIIGKPIELPNGVTAVPVSRVSFGFGSGGADLPGKDGKEHFGGGIGGGVTVSPVAFLLASPNGTVRLMQLSEFGNAIENVINTVPETVDRVVSLFERKKETAAEAEACEVAE